MASRRLSQPLLQGGARYLTSLRDSTIDHSPAQSHRKLQQAVRKFHDEVVYPDAQAREEDGKRPSLEVVHKMACVPFLLFSAS